MPNVSRRGFNLIMSEPISHVSSMIFKKVSCELQSDRRPDAKNSSIAMRRSIARYIDTRSAAVGIDIKLSLVRLLKKALRCFDRSSAHGRIPRPSLRSEAVDRSRADLRISLFKHLLLD